MRCLADPNAFLADEEASERASVEKGGADRWSLDSRAERMLSNNKKRKSVRAQTYLKREAEATTDDMSRADEVHDADYGSDESRFREMSEERDGSEGEDDVEVPRRFWYRRKEDRLPFSHEEKERRFKAVKARCRVRRLKKAREELESRGDKKGEGEVKDESGKGNEADKPSASSSNNSKKPSRVERRAAALRRENGGAKARPTLAELRARLGKGAAKEEEDAATLLPAPSSRHVVPVPASLPAAAAAALPPPLPRSSSSSNSSAKKAAAAVVPTCAFTFTSRSMAANRLVSMRAELDTLHKNLQEARKDFEDLRRLERESAASRVIGVVDASTTLSAATTAHESHDKMMQSVKALTASCKAVTSVAAATQKEFKMQDRIKAKTADEISTTAKAKPAATVVSPSATMSAGIGTGTGPLGKTTLTAAATKTLPPTAPPAVPPPPPPPPPVSAIPPTPPQQKTPPPLSRRKKANMSNIHHISNHRPSRQLPSEGGGSGARSISAQGQQQLHPAGHQETTVPGMDHPTTTTCLFANEWVCVFCEYRLLYGEYPRMMGAVKSRKKLVAKKKDAQERAHRATTVGAPASTKSRMQCTCGRAHARAMQAVAKELGDDGHDHDHHHNDEHHHHHHHHHHDDQDHDHEHLHHNHTDQEQHITQAKLPLAAKQQASKT